MKYTLFTSTQYLTSQPRTVIIAVNGNLEGDIVPYNPGLDFTGKDTLHYSAQKEGFVDGDTSVLKVTWRI